MKYLLIIFLLLFSNHLFAQSTINLQGATLPGNNIIGSPHSTQNNYYETRLHLNDSDKNFFDRLLDEIHTRYKSASNKYSIYVDMGSNAGPLILDVKKYLNGKGYIQVGDGTGMTSSGAIEGVRISYGVLETFVRLGKNKKTEDSSIIIHFGMIN